MKRVITYGTYDLLHYGHIELLRRAREMGDYLIVALSTDEFNQIKNKKSYYDYEQRKMMLESIRYVDLVIPEEGWGQKEKDVDRFDVDVFVMGHDWEGSLTSLKISVKSFILTAQKVSQLPKSSKNYTEKIQNN